MWDEIKEINKTAYQFTDNFVYNSLIITVMLTWFMGSVWVLCSALDDAYEGETVDWWATFWLILFWPIIMTVVIIFEKYWWSNK